MSIFSGEIVNELYAQGVREVISCPGGRSAELLNSFLDHGAFQVESVYDERTAGFYALGRSIESQKPVVVLTTSGSAVAGLYPAALEAKYQVGGSLVLLTADRPEAYRMTGAPQTINQIDFFKTSGVESIDIKNAEDVKTGGSVVHLNVSLEDPNPNVVKQTEFKFEELMVVGSLRFSEKKKILNQLKNYKGFLVLEALSNLKVNDFPSATVIKCPDLFFSKVPITSFKSICRIGGVPVSKFWRSADLVESFYWGAYPFPGAVGCKALQLETLVERLLRVPSVDEGFKNRLEIYESLIEEALNEQEASEVAILKNLSDKIPEGSRVFLGNSLPIREWEHCRPERFENIGQRGVNGIDGSLAYFMGQLSLNKENWIILGDITTLYNISDFQILNKLKNQKVRIVVVNNSGGQIFSRMFNSNTDFFVNKQDFSFEKLADFCGLGYVGDVSEAQLPLKVMIELKPDNKSSHKLLDEWKAIEF